METGSWHNVQAIGCEAAFLTLLLQAEDRHREFSMATASVADSVGIALAAVAAFPVHRYFCSLWPTPTHWPPGWLSMVRACCFFIDFFFFLSLSWFWHRFAPYSATRKENPACCWHVSMTQMNCPRLTSDRWLFFFPEARYGSFSETNVYTSSQHQLKKNNKIEKKLDFLRYFGVDTFECCANINTPQKKYFFYCYYFS